MSGAISKNTTILQPTTGWVRMLSCESDWALHRRCTRAMFTLYYPFVDDKYEIFTDPILTQNTVIDFCSYDKGSEEPRKTTQNVLTFNFCNFTSTSVHVSEENLVAKKDSTTYKGGLFVERFFSLPDTDTPSEMLIIQKMDNYAHEHMKMECQAAVKTKNIGVFACGSSEVVSVNTVSLPSGERRSNLVIYKNVQVLFYKPVGTQATYELFRKMCFEKEQNPLFAELFELDVDRVSVLWPLVYSPTTKRIDNFMKLPAYFERNPLSHTIVSITPYELAFWHDDKTEDE